MTRDAAHNPYTSETHSGVVFDLRAPRPADVNIADIAHHLSMLCRFGGAVRKFYSVAEHCTIVESLAIREGHDQETCFAALMHDAAEAYIQDLASPLKGIMELYSDCAYSDCEHRITRAICEAFDIPNDVGTKDIVHQLDRMACRAEAHFLLEGQGASWRWTDVPLVHVYIQPFLPRAAETYFMERFKQYRPLRYNGRAVFTPASKEILA